MIKAYIGLIRKDGNEPDKLSGYRRTYIGETEETELAEILMKH